MNVYFCDVCGVRVTDVDLHSGHGMRRRNDVICAACLDLGKGKDWGAQHSHPVPVHHPMPSPAMAIAGSSNGSSAPAPHGLGSNPTPRPLSIPRPLEIARDRIRTMDEDVPPQPVAPVVLPSAPSLEDMPDDTAQVPVMDQELSSAAAGFAALTPSKRAVHEDEEDLEETPVPKLDDSGAQAMSPFESKDAAKDGSPESRAETADDSIGDSGLEDGQKSETAASDIIADADKPQAEGPARKRDASSRSSSKGRPGSSSKVSKSSKTGRARKAKGGNSQQLMLLSGLSLVVVLVFGVGLIVKTSGHSNQGVPKGFEDVSGAMRTAVSDAKSAAKAAIGTHDLAKLTGARDKIQVVRSASMRFEKVAKEHGWDDEQVGQAMTTYGVTDVLSLDRVLRDEIEITKAQQH